jgi:hypothetical protein
MRNFHVNLHCYCYFNRTDEMFWPLNDNCWGL